jgi:hypothetical protein
MFTTRKEAPIDPAWLDRVLNQCRDVMLNADSVIIVGVKPNAHDNHIWSPLSQPARPVYFISNDKLAERWCEENGPKKRMIGGLFKESVGEILRITKEPQRF